MRFYVSKDSLVETVNYFKTLEVNSPEQLGLFFYFKSLGLKNIEFKRFPKVSGMNDEEKDLFNNKLYHFGSVFDVNEDPGKRTCLFPFSIKQEIKTKDFYNGGSIFRQLLSRITDTMDNTLVDIFLDKGTEDQVKFKYNYLDAIKYNYLKDKRISKVYLAAWLLRFTPIEVEDDELSYEGFTRICVKYMDSFFKLTNKEKDLLFYDDLHNNNITYSADGINAEELRGLMNFAEGEEPEIREGGSDLNLERPNLPPELSRQYLEITGGNPTVNEVFNLLLKKKQIVLYGVPGVGKSRLIKEVESRFEDSHIVQFHPSSSYEEFIGGETLESGDIIRKPGTFLTKCIEASKDTNSKFLFVIDEINRGNISKIFGETIMALDREYEVNLAKPIPVNGELHELIKIPDNLYIIGTMNSADRSIAILDYAIRRRFGFVKLYPNYEVVAAKANTENLGIGLDRLLKELNDRIYSVLKDENLLLGQSYFLPRWIEVHDGEIAWTWEDLRVIFNYFIIPMLEEYTYGNHSDMIQILGDSIPRRIQDNEDFKKDLLEIFPDIEES